MIVYIYNIGVDLYNGFNGLRHRINWTYFTVLDGLAHPLYSLKREVGEDVGNYKLTAKSKSRNYKYEIIENDVFTILENKAQQIKPEVTDHPRNDEKQEPSKPEIAQEKESIKEKGTVKTGIPNLTPMYLSLMTISLVVAMYILLKKRNIKIK